MAAGSFNIQKASGGVLNIQPTDGTTNTSLVLPESGTLVSDTTLKTINGSSLVGTGNLTTVDLTTNQSIAGVKTFSSSPIVPTPTTGTQAVNKDYADLKVALASFVGTNQSLSQNGYQKLPGGLIIQWGTNGGGAVTFPIAFPTACFGIYTGVNTTVASQPSKAHTPTILNKTTTGFTFGFIDYSSPTVTNYSWVAVGY